MYAASINKLPASSSIGTYIHLLQCSMLALIPAHMHQQITRRSDVQGEVSVFSDRAKKGSKKYVSEDHTKKYRVNENIF